MWPQIAIAVAALLALALIAAWYQYSISSGLRSKALELYLWVPIFGLAGLGLIRYAAGVEALAPAAIAHLLVVVWALRTVYREVPEESPARLPGFLLILGAVVVWVGAVTFPGMSLPQVAARTSDHLFTAGGFLVGALISLAGFAALRTALRARGDALLSQLGLIALLIATVCWIVHLAFRATVMVTVAQASATAPPDWYQPLRLWSGAMYVAYMFLAYLSIAAYGAGLRRTGWVGKGWGRVLVGFGLIGAAGFLAPGPFRPPLVVQFAPYVMGMILLRQARVPQAAGAAVAGQS